MAATASSEPVSPTASATTVEQVVVNYLNDVGLAAENIFHGFLIDEQLQGFNPTGGVDVMDPIGRRGRFDA